MTKTTTWWLISIAGQLAVCADAAAYGTTFHVSSYIAMAVMLSGFGMYTYYFFTEPQ